MAYLLSQSSPTLNSVVITEREAEGLDSVPEEKMGEVRISVVIWVYTVSTVSHT